jgi:hypothetical protein
MSARVCDVVCQKCASSGRDALVVLGPPAGGDLGVLDAARAASEREELETVRAGFELARHLGRDAEGVEGLQLDDLVIQLRTTAAADDHVDLLLLPMAVPERGPDIWSDALVADAKPLGLESLAREARLEGRREAELDRRVLDVVLEVLEGEGAQASPTISSGRTGTRASSRPVASRSADTIAAVETTVGGSPTPLAP